MNIYNAIMKAADHIERNPSEFRFMACGIPTCGTPGCAIGWIGFYCGETEGQGVGKACEKLLGINAGEFYRRMSDICQATSDWPDKSWIRNYDTCARTLRSYAKTFHQSCANDNGAAFERFLTVALSEPKITAATESGAK